MFDWKKFKNRFAMASATAAAMAMSMPMSAAAVTVKDNLDPEKVVGKILDYLLLAGQLVGGGVMIYAVISFGMSIAQENPDQRSRAIMFVVAGAFLVGIKPILEGIGVIG